MDDRRLEQMLMRLLRRDLSAGTEAFRDELLVRCLAKLSAAAQHDAQDLDDEVIELLAAAGEASTADGHPYGAWQDGR